ncbi:2-C-methyl-D-erythritol 2,4-cyclodiphosphate synthase [Listeria grayi]|uniref:2-C-methyl-D-erythritol 2,4-cyclodiphosphate synthase n=1 Tax=Listeria grayi TaxID=1641 RepID=A0A378MEY2_LISGR|nr:2-C-methyl-D-erythritol 2,4-cyclodiphosphate synthase [Listeria grayi]
MIRIGQGYDVHQLAENRKLIIGGIEIPHELGLLGHSDADVLLHAITDAIIGAVCKRDIGYFFLTRMTSIKMLILVSYFRSFGKRSSRMATN